MVQHNHRTARCSSGPPVTGLPRSGALRAVALPALGADMPWWLSASCAAVLLTTVAGHVRALLRERAERRYDTNFMAEARTVEDPVQRTRLLLEYRRAKAAAGQSGPPQDAPREPSHLLPPA